LKIFNKLYNNIIIIGYIIVLIPNLNWLLLLFHFENINIIRININSYIYVLKFISIFTHNNYIYIYIYILLYTIHWLPICFSHINYVKFV